MEEEEQITTVTMNNEEVACFRDFRMPLRFPVCFCPMCVFPC